MDLSKGTFTIPTFPEKRLLLFKTNLQFDAKQTVVTLYVFGACCLL